MTFYYASLWTSGCVIDPQNADCIVNGNERNVTSVCEQVQSIQSKADDAYDHDEKQLSS